MKRFGSLIVVGLIVLAGCSVETKASNVICVPDQSDICNNCPADTAGDPQSGRHTCSHDGTTFGSCGSCAPVVSGSAFTSNPNTDPGSVVIAPPDPTAPTIDAACAQKLGVLAGKDDPNVPFTYAAVYDGKQFAVGSTAGAPMRSPAATTINGAGVMALYRSKGDALVATTFANGAWSPAVGISATSDGTPSLTSWGADVKAIFRQDDGYHHVATFTGGAWASTVDLIGDYDVEAPPGISEPSAISTGAPGVDGAAIIVGYTSNAGGLYRQEWRGDDWFSEGIRASTIDAAAFRPEIIPMAAGAFDLVSTYITSDGVLHFSTRTSMDQGSVWSADAPTDPSATPADAVRGLGLSDGRALVVFLDANHRGNYMIFDPSKTPNWTAPTPLFGDSTTTLASTPQLVRDPCGASAALAFAGDSGVGVLRFQNDTWSDPVMVAGIPASTYATPVAAPSH